MPPLQGVGVGQVHGNQPQGVHNAPQGLNGQAVHLGPGQTIRRAFQDAFSEVKGFFKSIGDRIQAHHESNVEKARTTSANRSAQKVVDSLLNPPVSEKKLASSLLVLAEKAGKLDSAAPLDKAMSILDGKLNSLSAEDKNRFLGGNFHQLKNSLTEQCKTARGQSNAFATAIHNSGLGGSNPPVLQTGPSAKEILAGQVLDRLNHESKTTFATETNNINHELSNYFGTQNMTAQLMFRGNADVTKSMAKYLGKVNGNAVESTKQQTISQAKQTAKETGQMEIGSYGKLDLAKVSTEQFQAMLDGAGELMKTFMGGTTDEGARIAAANLSPNVVRLLKMQDQQVNANLNGDQTARETAFAGTLFLRSLTAALTDAQPGQSEHNAAIMKVFSQACTFALNQSKDAGRKMDGLSPENQDAVNRFVDSYANSLATFRTTVLARTDV